MSEDCLKEFCNNFSRSRYSLHEKNLKWIRFKDTKVKYVAGMRQLACLALFYKNSELVLVTARILESLFDNHPLLSYSSVNYSIQNNPSPQFDLKLLPTLSSNLNSDNL